MVTRIGPKKPFKIYLAQRRETEGLTQEQLAERIESTKASISRWETGERDPPAKALAALAYALHCEIADLFIDPARPSADSLLRDQSDRIVKKAFKLVETLVEDEIKGTGTGGRRS
ncbi:MAG: helix-turn-helix transcriptional regulator [Aestuariivirga sp.]|nr:helix-turn-helix transcriptional regulator [Aestuariivirga sp.]